MEALRQNEYFARRWWELEALDHRQDKQLCLISLEDLIKIEKKLLLDLREFKIYNVMHMKGSFHMVTPVNTDHQIYIKFLSSYQQRYPDNFIVLIGDQDDMGFKFGTKMV